MLRSSHLDPSFPPVRDAYVHKYLEPWLAVYYGQATEQARIDLNCASDLVSKTVTPSRDESLTAFCQLAAMRLDCRRALISLVDSQAQHILAEATRTMTLDGRDWADADDAPFIGRATIVRSSGVCGRALDAMLRSSRQAPYLVVPDLLTDSTFNKYQWVTPDTPYRFYAGVPVFGPDNHIIGVYCVFDDKPRDALSESELSFLHATARTVHRHLEGIRMRVLQSRGERMVRSLNLFLGGQASVRKWWIGEQAHAKEAGDIAISEAEIEEAANELFGPDHKPGCLLNPNALHVSRPDPMKRTDSYIKAVNTPLTVPQEDAWQAASKSSLATKEEHSLFDRASNLIREADSFNSVVFFDASFNDSPSSAATGVSPLANGCGPGATPQQMSRSPSQAGGSAVCPILGFSVSAKSSLMGHEPSPHHKGLSQGFLKELIAAYPNGKVFNFTTDGSVASSSESDEPTRATGRISHEQQDMHKIAPKARSLAFLPLWDWSKSRWFAGCFAWTTDPMRVLDDQQDLSFLRAFGANIMHEVSRLDATRSEKSKDHFLSTISHEMRSPLHGILAGAEFLRDVPMDAFGENMLATIQTSGKTLLDTINHVLEYANISSSVAGVRPSGALAGKDGEEASSSSSGGGGDKAGGAATADDLDLALVVEEVVNSVCLGSLGKTDQEMQHNSATYSPATVSSSRRSSWDVTPSMPYIIIKVDWRKPWTVRGISATAIRRIIMNLVRNSFKFTASGFIIVSLHADDAGAGRERIVLEVEDSGCGMSPEFLRHHIYTPFVKESSLTPGIGLGLHLTRNMVMGFGGQLEFDSAVGVGTTARVSFPAQARPVVPRLQRSRSIPECLIGASVAMLGFNETASRGAMALKDSLNSILGDALEVKLTYLDSLSQSEGDVLIIRDEHFESSVSGSVSRDSDKPLVAPMIVLCQSFAYAHRASREYPHIQFVVPPFGPTSLGRTFARCQGASSNDSDDEAAMLSTAQRKRPAGGGDDGGGDDGDGSRMATRTKRLKIVTPATAKKQPASSAAATATAPLGIRLLVVEDNEINLKLLVAFAKKHQVEFEAAHHGREALEIYLESLRQGRRFDVVLTDVSMPLMDGLELTRQVRQTEAAQELPATLVIALTGVSSDLARRDAVAAGVDVFLSKPAPFKQILRVLETRAQQQRDDAGGPGGGEALRIS